MEEEGSPQLVVSIMCLSCSGEIRLGDQHCRACNRPVSRDEVLALRARLEAADPLVARGLDGVEYGRVTLLIVAGLSFVEGMFWLTIDRAVAIPLIYALVSVGMLGLYQMGRTRPLGALLAGLAGYLAFQGIAALVTTVMGLAHVVIQGLILMALGGGISAQLWVRKREKSLARAV